MIFKKYIQFFKEEDWGQLKKFIRKNTHKKYILADRKYFDWQFISPYKATKTPSVLILKAKEKILGYLGIIPVKMNYFGTEITGGCLVNLMTDISLRNKGAGVDFIERAQMEKYDIIYTTNYTQPVGNIYGYLNWEKEFFLRRFLFILDKEKVIKLTGEQINISEFKFDERLLDDSECTFEESHVFGDEVDKLWIKVKDKYNITIARRKQYLNWRYVRHPFFKYRIFYGKKNGQLESFVVLRLEKTKEFVVWRIIDFIATDNIEKYTLANVVAFCKRQNAQLIDFLFIGNFHTTSLKQLGFKEGNKKPYSLIPIRFNPIDKNVMTINFAFICLNKNMRRKHCCNVNDWYITIGDGDQDRPNPR